MMSFSDEDDEGEGVRAILMVPPEREGESPIHLFVIGPGVYRFSRKDGALVRIPLKEPANVRPDSRLDS
jgi:hypothetical protein